MKISFDKSAFIIQSFIDLKQTRHPNTNKRNELKNETPSLQQDDVNYFQ